MTGSAHLIELALVDTGPAYVVCGVLQQARDLFVDQFVYDFRRRANDERVVGKTLPSVTTAPATTRQFLPMTAPFRMTACTPINEPSPTVQPWSIA